jgi:hypothetical protein
MANYYGNLKVSSDTGSSDGDEKEEVKEAIYYYTIHFTNLQYARVGIRRSSSAVIWTTDELATLVATLLAQNKIIHTVDSIDPFLPEPTQLPKINVTWISATEVQYHAKAPLRLRYKKTRVVAKKVVQAEAAAADNPVAATMAEAAAADNPVAATMAEAAAAAAMFDEEDEAYRVLLKEQGLIFRMAFNIVGNVSMAHGLRNYKRTVESALAAMTIPERPPGAGPTAEATIDEIKAWTAYNTALMNRATHRQALVVIEEAINQSARYTMLSVDAIADAATHLMATTNAAAEPFHGDVAAIAANDVDALRALCAKQTIKPTLAAIEREAYSRGPAYEALPAGVEMRTSASGRAYYIDHNTKTTSWCPPKKVAAASNNNNKSAGCVASVFPSSSSSSSSSSDLIIHMSGDVVNGSLMDYSEMSNIIKGVLRPQHGGYF